jgi:predicted dehydrogenase
VNSGGGSKANRITRRNMIQRSAVGAAAIGLGVYRQSQGAAERSVVPARRPIGPNDCIRIGVIGVGGQGGNHLRSLVERAKNNPKLAVVAVCDVYEPRKQAAGGAVRKANTGKQADGVVYHEYERMLESPDVDAVVVATPDHWHARIAIDAIKAGKDVYVEKPMTHTIEQARELRDTAVGAGAAVQVGAQSTSKPLFHQVHEMIKRGAIGKVIWTSSGMSRNVLGGDWNWPIDSGANTKNLDWDRWLGWEWGLAPRRPFDAERYFRFRKFWDYSGGIATDLQYHCLAHLAVVLGAEFPARVVASGGNWVHKDREVPDTFLMNIDYPSEHSVFMMGTDANDEGIPEIIHGQYGSILLDDFKVEPQKAFARQFEEARKQGAQDVAKPALADHMDNWLECIRTRGTPTCNVEMGYRVQVAITMAVLAYRKNKAIYFDPKTEMVRT